MKKRGLLIAITIFAALLFSGVVYAAGSHGLVFTGRVARTSFLNLDLADIAIANIRPGESADLADVTKKSLRFNVLLIEPGDSRSISFNMSNTGNMAAR
ncbi:MAG: hypothetical protein FWD39_01905, partial [Clostridiales bacterium]|nr:hypothetical protein [Clostridiales bacterium]